MMPVARAIQDADRQIGDSPTLGLGALVEIPGHRRGDFDNAGGLRAGWTQFANRRILIQ